MEYPFYYEVRFNVLKFDYDNKLIEGKTTLSRVFKEKSPLENRAEAFAEFDEFIKTLKTSKRLIANNRGNYIIFQPPFLSEQLKLMNRRDSFFRYSEGARYQENVSVYLIITDGDLLKTLDLSWISEEILIHKVSSSEYNEQDVVDNLEMVELELYKTFDINVSGKLKTVYHYGEDYADEEDEEEGAKRTILETPYTWKTKGDYLNDMLFDPEIENNYDNQNNGSSIQIIKSGTKGITYKSLFKECLDGATEIVVTDPWIRNMRQKENFIEFIALVRSLNRISFRKVDLTLVTYYSDGYRESSEMFFDDLKEILEENDDVIRFSYRFDKKVHDRSIKTNTGWLVLLGRGLDIYYNYKDYFFEKHFPEYRTCREFHISKTNNVKNFKSK